MDFDAFTFGSAHYLAVLPSFFFCSENAHDVRMMDLAPMEGEWGLNAEKHYEFLSYVLVLYKKLDLCCLSCQ